jgi:hypothetical protein
MDRKETTTKNRSKNSMKKREGFLRVKLLYSKYYPNAVYAKKAKRV